MKFSHSESGPRGINLKDGTTLWVEPGETVEVDKKSIASVHAHIVEGEADPEPVAT